MKYWTRIKNAVKLTICLSLLLSSCAKQLHKVHEGARLKIISYGIYEQRQTRQVPDANMPGNTIHLFKDIELKINCDSIPGTLGVRFGFQYRVDYQTEDSLLYLRAKWEYPPPGMQNGTTGISSLFSETTVLVRNHDINYIDFGFDHSYEIIGGKWRFSVYDDSGNQIEKEFIVIPEPNNETQG